MTGLDAAAEATWPPLRRIERPGFTLREGGGGGKRVSAATAHEDWTEAQLGAAIAAMHGLDQPPLFRVAPGEEALDTALAARGFAVVDPVTLWHVPTAHFADEELRRLTAFCVWEPLAIQREIWAAGGIGTPRLAVMERAAAPKTSVFGRIKDKPAGSAFCALSEGIAFVHALHVLPEGRRNGLARWMTIAAAHWAAANGADTLAVLCTDANTAANALYARLGFTSAPGYHYRQLNREAP
ncbi:GNAT family N-acetyltransferase [Roseivivax sediminis]|uniref:Acetyltransferase (GNAT) family protein n=1 Tax=Roseivivax sediminis TaxID=936889 RepID=A0A1I1ZMW7_9RHOB|nr:GNAT family N-acetyltransferase [Roseivivax sediminis]SFE33036.1 Acetyltransferase (GNAT) family protein [Roseivivax sediminis]